MVRDPVCLMELDLRNAKAVVEYKGRSYHFYSTQCKEKFLTRPKAFIDKAPGMRLTVGVMGSADNEQAQQTGEIAYALGRAIAKRGYALITGACPGLPYECARGATNVGGLSIGISPALSLDEHAHKYHSPSDNSDVNIYTASGLMGREVTNICSSDMAIILGRRSSTLGEFAIAYDEGKLIGVLEGSGGITAKIPDIVASSEDKDTGARLIYDADPQRLIATLSETYVTAHYRHPSCFCNASLSAG